MPLTSKGAESGNDDQAIWSREGRAATSRQEQAVAAAMREKRASDAKPLYGAKRGRDIFFGSKDQQPALMTTPNAAIPAFASQIDDDD